MRKFRLKKDDSGKEYELDSIAYNGVVWLKVENVSYSYSPEEVEEVTEPEPISIPPLSKREYFAVLAMQGILASFTEKAANGNWGTENELVIENSILLADELLKQLENGK